MMMHINDGNKNIQPRGSFSMPIRSSATASRRVSIPAPVFDEQLRESILQDIEHAKQDLLRFRGEMDGLAQQLVGMTTDLEAHKDRVSEIDHDLTTTQEENVDFQVVLENAVKNQKESDGKTTFTIRRMHSNLANVIFESRQLQERITSLAQHQLKHHGNVEDVGEKMREYVLMLEQAQGTLKNVLRASRMPRTNIVVKSRDEIVHALSIPNNIISRRGSTTSIASTPSITSTQSSFSTLSSVFQPPQKQSVPIAVPTIVPMAGKADASQGLGSLAIDQLYRHRIIRRPSLPATRTGASITTTPTASVLSSKKSSQSPQEGLRILLQNNRHGLGLGLSSLADQNNTSM